MMVDFSCYQEMTHKQGKLAHVAHWVMQADCYLCLSEANLKISRVALCLQSCTAENHRQQQELLDKVALGSLRSLTARHLRR